MSIEDISTASVLMGFQLAATSSDAKMTQQGSAVIDLDVEMFTA